MEKDGIKWNKMEDAYFMIPFCGYDRCSLDANGRLKLSPATIADFGGNGAGVVLRCLPEGAIGVYTEQVFLKMRRSGAEEALSMAASSSLFRRNLRMLNAMSSPAQISPQGRLTLPRDFRIHAGLDQDSDAVVVGVEIGVEIWSLRRWTEEQQRIIAHDQERSELEMQSDLNRLKEPSDMK